MTEEQSPIIPLSECEDRRVYRIHSRNLKFGAFDVRKGGFVGIREKFGERYLFVEFHHDTGPPFGTVRPKEALEVVIPESVSMDEYELVVEDGQKRYRSNPELFGILKKVEAEEG